MAIEVDSLELRIEHDGQQAVSQLDNVVKSLNGVQEATARVAKAKGIGNIAKQSAQSNSYVAALTSQIKKLKSEQATYEKHGIGFGDYAYDRNYRTISIMEGELKNYQQTLKRVAKSTEDTKESTKKLSKATLDAGKSANKSSGFFGKLGKSIKRVLFYRAIRMMLSSITQALKEGISNLYQYSAAMNSMDAASAANTMDGYASSLLKVKNSIAAAVMPILQALLPMIQTITNAFVTAINVINQFFSALQGKGTFTKATDASAKFAENMGGAAGSAAEVKRQLMGFDELNILDEPSSGGGGGGGASSVDYGSMFEEATIDPKILEFVEKIKNLIKDLSPYIEDIGNAIDEVKTAFKKLSDNETFQLILGWIKEGVKNTVVMVLKGIATAIRLVAKSLSFIESVLSGDWQSAWDELKAMFDEVEGFLSELISGGYSANANTLYEIIFGGEEKTPQWFKDFVEAAKDPFVNTFIKYLSGGLLGENGIFDLINNNMKKQQSLKDALGEAWDQKSFAPLKEWYDTEVSSIFKPEKWRELGLGAFGALKDSIATGSWQPFKTWWDKNVKPHYENSKWYKLGSSAWKGLKEAIGEIIDFDAIKEWYDKKVKPWFNLFTWKTNGQTAVTGLKNGLILSTWNVVKDWWNENVAPWFTLEKWKTIATNALSSLKQGFTINLWKPIKTWWNDNVAPWFTNSKWFNNGKTGKTGLKNGLSLSGLNPIKDWWNNNIAPWFTWQKWYNLGKDAIQALKDGLKAIALPQIETKQKTTYTPTTVNGSVTGSTRTTLPYFQWSTYATGAYGIPKGQLFIANEAGAEYIGSMNGKSTVANNAQIIEGIRQGAYEGFIAAMANSNGGNNHITVQVGDTTLADVVIKALNNQTRKLGYSQLEGI